MDSVITKESFLVLQLFENLMQCICAILICSPTPPMSTLPHPQLPTCTTLMFLLSSTLSLKFVLSR